MKRWIVTSAWPYAHGPPHLGNIVSCLLSADIFSRFLRIDGQDVIYVTGSDEHGTPIEVKALELKIPPKKLTDKVHNQILEILKGFNIKPDNYTRTHNDIHIEYVRDIFMKIFNNGYIFTKIDKVLFCPRDKIYLPDRFVVGKCPYCGYNMARGDQCENCGKLLTPLELIDPRCAICGERPIVKTEKHFYIDLTKFSKKLYEWIKNSDTLTENAKNFSLQMLKQGLKPRSVTRNNKWGIPAPFPGADGLTIYVWFDAVLGYVSAVKELFIKKYDNPDKWKEWWWDKDTHVAFFIGKDNIPFHTIIFPSLLMGSGDPYTLNFHISSVEWLTFEGRKFSKSQGIGIWGDEAIKLLPADYWRYTLVLIRPESKDTDFTWKILEYAVNEEMNNQLGNLVHRVFTLVNRYQAGKVTYSSPSTDAQKELYEEIIRISEKVRELYYRTRFQRVLNEVMKIVKKANIIINDEKPWELYQSDPYQLKSLLYILVKTIRDIAIMLYPIIPDSMLKIFDYLNYDKKKLKWSEIKEDFREIKIKEEVKPLFNKISIGELQRKLYNIRGIKEEIDYKHILKMDIRVGRIVKAERKKGTKKILRLYIDIGTKIIKVLAGISDYYKPEHLIDKKVIVVTNIKRKKIIDEYSEGMLLAAVNKDGEISLLTPDRDISEGSEVK